MEEGIRLRVQDMSLLRCNTILQPVKGSMSAPAAGPVQLDFRVFNKLRKIRE
jgi:hypothetical protein